MSRELGPVVLLHAYSASNRGDGLLVSESLGLLHRAGMAPGRAVVVAFDSASFGPSVATLQYPGAPGSSRRRMVADYGTLAGMAAGGVVCRRMLERTELGRLIRGAALIVGVGGGYLRVPGGSDSIPALTVQLPQLALATRASAPTIYLPQSVGPLRGAIGRALGAQVRALDFIAVRDDRSLDELASPAAFRVPDLAVLAVARQWGARSPRARVAAPSVIGIARDLARPGGYEQALMELDRRLSMTWAVQARTRRQDDAAFYRRLGLRVGDGTASALQDRQAGVVVSVRLHGAVQAILAGIPAIHLTYERKGYGAYDDLGISPWLHSARGFDPEVVAAQAAELPDDPAPYWTAVENRLQHLLAADACLVERVRAVLAC